MKLLSSLCIDSFCCTVIPARYCIRKKRPLGYCPSGLEILYFKYTLFFFNYICLYSLYKINSDIRQFCNIRNRKLIQRQEVFYYFRFTLSFSLDHPLSRSFYFSLCSSFSFSLRSSFSFSLRSSFGNCFFARSFQLFFLATSDALGIPFIP